MARRAVGFQSRSSVVPFPPFRRLLFPPEFSRSLGQIFLRPSPSEPFPRRGPPNIPTLNLNSTAPLMPPCLPAFLPCDEALFYLIYSGFRTSTSRPVSSSQTIHLLFLGIHPPLPARQPLARPNPHLPRSSLLLTVSLKHHLHRTPRRFSIPSLIFTSCYGNSAMAVSYSPLPLFWSPFVRGRLILVSLQQSFPRAKTLGFWRNSQSGPPPFLFVYFLFAPSWQMYHFFSIPPFFSLPSTPANGFFSFPPPPFHSSLLIFSVLSVLHSS